MLVLTRKPDEKVVVRFPHPDGSGDDVDIIVTVARVELDERGIEQPSVRLGFTAPSWVQIDRQEIRESKDGR